MNNNYYQNPIYQENNNISPYNNQKRNNYNNIIEEQYYIENVLKNNKGKIVKIHLAIPEINGYQNKTLEGRIEQVGKDYIIISNPKTKEKELIPLIYIILVTFLDSINY